MNITRRQCWAGLAALAAAPVLPAAPSKSIPICAFSKHFQWTGIEEMAALCKELGYDGVDLTVRPGGHVEPERVEDDLPKAVEILHRAGLQTPMVTAGIIDVTTPHTEKVLKTLQSLSIRNYRWGGFRYDDQTPIEQQIAALKPKVHELATLNQKFGVRAMYHTHSGIDQVGASMWDLYLLLKDENPAAVAPNFDIGHATVEGGLGGWLNSSRLLVPKAGGLVVKDFFWAKNAKGKWVADWCPMGKGMVNFARFFQIVKQSGWSGPLQHHMEFDELGGANDGKRQISITKEQFKEIARRDLDQVKSIMTAAGLSVS